MTPDIIAALEEAKIQLAYLDERFPTGTTPAVIARIDAALSTSPAGQEVREVYEIVGRIPVSEFPGKTFRERQDNAAKVLAALSSVEPASTGQEVRESEIDQAKSEGMDQAADFCIQTLAKALGVDDWQQADGSETWDGDVAGTIYNVLKAGRVYDDEDGRVARLEDASVEPAGNGREETCTERRAPLCVSGEYAQAAEQEAVKCKRCNDTGWIIGNGTVREGCLSCDAQINMARATHPAPASSGEGDELRHKLWMVISHASGGHLSKEDDSDRSINDICVEISRHHNRIWEQALEKGRQEATTSTERGR